MPATAVNSDVLDRWLRGCAAAIAEQRDYLTQLDAAIGDADHGANMTRGFAAVQEKLDDLDGGTPPGKLLIGAGSTLVSTVGGASGPLWGSALRKAGRSLGDAELVGPEALVDALDAALGAIVELGAAELGDKTMVDALAPAIESMRSSLARGGTLEDALASARVAAEEGMRATVPMVARKGRASYLGERSVGHQDPGATSVAIVVAALERAVHEAP
jgi:phosphoenolpyruvate---glycerone phosphotransferase subunit DhaL